MGYEQYDMTDVVNTVNAFANGKMTIDELENGPNNRGRKKNDQPSGRI
jgi:hypothetical protein